MNADRVAGEVCVEKKRLGFWVKMSARSFLLSVENIDDDILSIAVFLVKNTRFLMLLLQMVLSA